MPWRSRQSGFLHGNQSVAGPRQGDVMVNIHDKICNHTHTYLLENVLQNLVLCVDDFLC